NAPQPPSQLRHKLVDLASRPSEKAQILRKQRWADEDEECSDADEQDASCAEEPRSDRHVEPPAACPEVTRQPSTRKARRDFHSRCAGFHSLADIPHRIANHVSEDFFVGSDAHETDPRFAAT